MASDTSYLGELNFEAGELKIQVTDGTIPIGILRFNYVRSFLFIKESDFWQEFNHYQNEPLALGHRVDGMVFRITAGAMLSTISGSRFDEGKPTIYRVWTPDECLEVIGFENPTFTAAS